MVKSTIMSNSNLPYVCMRLHHFHVPDMYILCDLHKNRRPGMLRKSLRVTWVKVTFLELECMSLDAQCPSLLSNLRNKYRNSNTCLFLVLSGYWMRAAHFPVPGRLGILRESWWGSLFFSLNIRVFNNGDFSCKGPWGLDGNNHLMMASERYHPGGQVCPQPGRVLLVRKQMITLLQMFPSGDMKRQPGPGSAHVMSL